MFNFLKKAKIQIRKAEAAAALENLLKIQSSMGNIVGDPHIMANGIIAESWERSSKQVDWTKSKLPHKVSLVAIALSERLERTQIDEESFYGYGIALGTVLSTALRGRDTLGFSPLDEMLFAKAIAVSEAKNSELTKLPIAKELDEFIPRGEL